MSMPWWQPRGRCVLCDLHDRLPDAVLCAGCQQDLPWRLEQIRLDHRDIQVLFHYQWPVDRLLHLFKYQQRLDLIRIFQYALQYASPVEVDAVVAMPCSAARLRQRGYNQAHLFAQQLGQLWQLPIWPHLQRVKHQPAQQRLDRAERLDNLKGAFVVAAGQRPPKRVLLIDDVLTTGSSFGSAADCLHQAGVDRIEGLVIASHHSP